MKYFLCITFFIGCSFGFGQTQPATTFAIQGKVTEEKTLIDFAQVVIQSLSGQVLSYTVTDDDGKYRLEFTTTEDSILLQVARLGYMAQEIKLSSSTSYFGVELQLSEDSKLLEVVIEDRPIEELGDTIGYFTEPFIDGTERSAEDVLAKLPGISVDKNSGTIKYQGKEIKKILLDGDDLTGQNYKVLSKNLSADWLQEVEVLKRFTDSRLLQGIQQSDEVAINLKLKEEAKAPLFGTLEAGIGNTSKYMGKAELLSYMRKLKLFALGELNNTGSDLETYDLETYTSSQLEYKGFLFPEQVLENQLSPPSFFKRDNFTFHEGQFFSNSMLVKPSSNSTVRSITTIYNNQLNFDFIDSLAYLLPNQEVISLTQRQTQKQHPIEVFQDIKTDHQVSENADILTRWQWKLKSNDFNTLNKTNFSEILDQSESQSNELFGSISLINRWTKNWVSTFDVEFGKNQLVEEFTLNSPNSNVDSIRQEVDQDYKNIGLFARLDGVLTKGFYANMLVGGSKTTSYFKFQSLPLNASETSGLDEYRFTNFFTEFGFKKQFKIATISGGSRLRNAEIEYRENVENQVLVEPTLSFSLEKDFSELHSEFKALYNREYVFLKPNQLYNVPLLMDFRSVIFYHAEANRSRKNDISAISFKVSEDKRSYITGYAEWVYLKSNHVLANHLSFEDDIVQSILVQEGMSKNFFSNYTLDKYFAVIRSTIKLAYEESKIFTPLSIENISGDNKLRNSILSVTSGTSLGQKINVSLAYKYNRSDGKWDGVTNRFSFKNYFAKISFKPIKTFHISTNYQIIDFGNERGGNSSILSAKVRFTKKDDKISIELIANNIANNRGANISSLEPSTFTLSSFPVQQRFFLLTGRIRF